MGSLPGKSKGDDQGLQGRDRSVWPCQEGGCSVQMHGGGWSVQQDGGESCGIHQLVGVGDCSIWVGRVLEGLGLGWRHS